MSAIAPIEFLVEEGGILPTRQNDDVGYDISIVKLAKVLKVEYAQYESETREGKLSTIESAVQTVMFDTCVRVKPPPGYWSMLVVRSSFCKLEGFELEMPNAPGIIDPSYQGTMRVCLRNLPGTPFPSNLPLPLKCCQLICMPAFTPEIKQVTTLWEKSERGEGGFGSTG